MAKLFERLHLKDLFEDNKLASLEDRGYFFP